MKHLKFAFVIGLLMALGGCEPEVGSERWCKMMKDKPVGDWTTNESIDYAKNCVIG